jgi:hypothetical protein
MPGLGIRDPQGIYYFGIPSFAAQKSQTSLNSRSLRDFIPEVNSPEQGITGNEQGIAPLENMAFEIG